MSGQGPLALREMARRIGDVEAVHGGIRALRNVGLLAGRRRRHVNFTLHTGGG